MSTCHDRLGLAMIPAMELFGAVELGGTKTLAAVGTSGGELQDMVKFDTGDDPLALTTSVVAYLGDLGIRALGISAFGPLDLDPTSPSYGTILATPKAGWQGHNLLESIGRPLGVPAAIDTDVNGAALAEGLWGAARGADPHVYMTVGTGIGAGVVADGRPLRGLSHPELGHIPVTRRSSDRFEGTCPYHRDCLEGMAAGPAVVGRFGGQLTELPDAERGAALDLITSYVAQGVRALVYTVSPMRVVIGGGVSRNEGFHAAVTSSLLIGLAGYGVTSEHEAGDFVVPPALGDRSGLVGGLALAAQAGAA